jgi:Ca-activated chloride channel family protein
MAKHGGELGWLRLRYKSPAGGSSRLMERALLRGNAGTPASPRLRWAAAVAAYADLLRGGTHVGNFGWDQVHALAAGARGTDRWGYRAEFLTLVDRARTLTEGQAAVAVSQ